MATLALPEFAPLKRSVVLELTWAAVALNRDDGDPTALTVRTTRDGA